MGVNEAKYKLMSLASVSGYFSLGNFQMPFTCSFVDLWPPFSMFYSGERINGVTM